uniref:Type III pantothenate kinase n=1 Tax=candidate division WOR-3 bacterium TaxID=2052148 RepID=A0A7C2NYV6_UNCW3
MDLLICVDVGNVNIHTGLFSDGKLIQAFDGLPKLVDLREAKALVYSSVSSRNFKKLSERLFEAQYKGKVLRLSSKTQKFLKVHYKNPFQLGDDRLALAYYIWRRHGKGLGIDAGTFINIEWVNNQTHYPIAIFPGLKILADSFKKGTRLKSYSSIITYELAKGERFLGEKSIRNYSRFFPESSEDCIIKGIVDALKGLVEGAVKLTGEDRVIITGGDGEILRNITNIGEYEKHAVLWGLYYFFQLSESSSNF